MLRRVVAFLVLTAAAFVATGARVQAADLEAERSVASEGVDCEASVAKTFDSVWLGHFTGGYSHALGPGLPVVLDWRDEKLCFPSKRSCDRYMSVMRREFHRPEGYFTCLPIR